MYMGDYYMTENGPELASFVGFGEPELEEVPVTEAEETNEEKEDN